MNDVAVVLGQVGRQRRLCLFAPASLLAAAPAVGLRGSLRHQHALREVRPLHIVGQVGDDGLRGDADAAVVDGEVVAGEALGPAVVVAAHDGLAAVAGSLADGAAGLDGVVEELQGADRGIHGAEEEREDRAAAGTHQLLVLLDGEDGVFLGAVVEVVGHAGDVPGHGAAHGDAHRLARRALRPRAHPQPQGHRHQGAQHPPPPPWPPPGCRRVAGAAAPTAMDIAGPHLYRWHE